MSSTKKQNTKLMTAIAIIFAILIILGFVTLLMISAENSPATKGHEHAFNSSQVGTHGGTISNLNA